jgi:heat shock protein HslJ
MMACMEPAGVMEQETAYLAALATAAAFTVQGSVLELRTADGALAVSYVAQEPAALGTNEWLITSYNNGRDAAVSPLLNTELTLAFQEDGNVTGSAGCNRYFGAFVADGDALQIGPLATTRALCPEPEGAMTQEQEFLAALQAAATFTIQGDMLDIRMADGAIAVMAVPNTPLPAEIQSLVENAVFQVTAVESGPVTLSSGVYTQAIADSASSVQVTLLEPAAFGQVNGQPAAAVVLATNTGGTGTFIDLALVTFENGQPVNVATTSLGDRVQVNSVDITAEGVIVVDMVTHSESDPLCCPTQHVINTYSLQDGALVETSSTPA